MIPQKVKYCKSDGIFTCDFVVYKNFIDILGRAEGAAPFPLQAEVAVMGLSF